MKGVKKLIAKQLYAKTYSLKKKIASVLVIVSLNIMLRHVKPTLVIVITKS